MCTHTFIYIFFFSDTLHLCIRAHPFLSGPVANGQVILVEARHLRPARVQQEQDLQTALQKSLQLDLQVEAGRSETLPFFKGDGPGKKKTGIRTGNQHGDLAEDTWKKW